MLPRITDDNGKPLPSSQLVDVARQIAGNRLLLSFSGKDSLAAWLFLRDNGFEIIPYFCYTVRGLSYDEEMLDYYEKFFQTHIIRLPHPVTYGQLNASAWLPLHVWRTIYYCHLPRFDYTYIENILAEQYNLGENYLSAVGIRATDSLGRRRFILQGGAIGLKRRRYYFAIWDFTSQMVREYIKKHKVKLSKSYLYFGSTGDGIEYKFLRFLKDNLPQDFEKVKALFPEVELELFRYEKVK